MSVFSSAARRTCRLAVRACVAGGHERGRTGRRPTIRDWSGAAMQAQRADAAPVRGTQRKADPLAKGQCVQSGVPSLPHWLHPEACSILPRIAAVPDFSPPAPQCSCFVSEMCTFLMRPHSHGLRCVAPLDGAAGGTEGTDVCLNKFALQVYKTGGGQNCLDFRWLAGDIPTFLELGAQIVSRLQPSAASS